MKKFYSVLIALSLLTMLCACGNKTDMETSVSDQLSGVVRYVNSDPELAEKWQEIAYQYTEESGVPVEIVSLPQSDYTEQLTTLLNSDSAPTVFDVHSIGEFKQFTDYCYDLTGAKVLNQVITNAFSLSKDGKWNAEGNFGAVGYSLTSCGLIYNKSLLERAGYRVQDINAFDSLNTVFNDIQSRKDELGISGVIAPVSVMDADRYYDFYANLYNVAVFPYLESNGYSEINYIDEAPDIMINLSDLINTTGGQTEESTDINGFINGRYVFCFASIESYNNAMRDAIGYENIGILPLYIGTQNEDKQGLCTNALRYWCVNKNASKEDVAASLDFLSWIAENQSSNDILEIEMNIHTPFVNAATTTNPLVASMIESLATRKNPMVNYLDVGFEHNWIS